MTSDIIPTIGIPHLGTTCKGEVKECDADPACNAQLEAQGWVVVPSERPSPARHYCAPVNLRTGILYRPGALDIPLLLAAIALGAVLAWRKFRRRSVKP